MAYSTDEMKAAIQAVQEKFPEAGLILIMVGEDENGAFWRYISNMKSQFARETMERQVARMHNQN